MYLLASACSLIHSGTLLQTKVVDEVLVDGPRGAVFLQKAEDGWFRTAHPLSLNLVVLSSVFQGVHVQTSPTDKAPQERVFSEEDIEFLAPLIRAALTKAAKSQVVGFRVIHGTDAGDEITGGILYVQGRLLHLTLTHYRAQQEGVGQDSASRRLVPNPTGLRTHQVGFIPEAARRSSRNEQPDVTAVTSLASLVLDYETLTVGAVPPPTPIESRPSRPDVMPVSQPPVQSIHPTTGAAHIYGSQMAPLDENRGVQAPVTEKETELETLKEQLRTLQRRLSELDSEMHGSKKP